MIRCAALAAFLLSSPAYANWLDDAWTGETVNRDGGPAVTLNDDGVTLVLPADTVAAAHAQGFDTRQMVTLFIERYGQHCAGIIDLDQKQRLRVQLFVSQPVDLNDASEETQQEVGDSLTAMAKGSRRVAHVEQLFVTAPEHQELIIDYEPTRKASCIIPGDNDSTS
jgi:hypothetical protein